MFQPGRKLYTRVYHPTFLYESGPWSECRDGGKLKNKALRKVNTFLDIVAKCIYVIPQIFTVK